MMAAQRNFEIGANVILRIGGREMLGRVVEDRGFIGPNGTQIVSIQVFSQEVGEPVLVEVPVTALSAVPCNLRICNDCGLTLPRDRFYRSARHRDGLQPRCKACDTAARRNLRRARPDIYNAQMVRNNRRKGSVPVEELPPIAKRARWTPDEDALVTQRAMTDRELADVLHRSAKAIEQRRWRLTRAAK
jgi:hypothetical protein